MIYRALFRRCGLLLLAVLAFAVPCFIVPSAAPAPVAAATHLAANWVQSDTPVGPGTQMTTFQESTGRGPVRGSMLVVDLGNPKLSVKLLDPGPLAAAQPVSEMVANNGAIAGVNGDFFDIYHTSAPYGVAVSDGQVLKGPIWSWTQAAGVGQDGIGRIAEMNVNGTIQLPSGPVDLLGLNQHNIPKGGIGLYTTAWGPASRRRAVEEGATGVQEVTVQNDVVVGKAGFAGDGWIPADSFVLLGREGGGAALAALNIGDPVSVAYWPWTNAPAPFQMAVGGKTILVRDGQVQNVQDDKSDPRTAIGFSADGHRMILVTIDGRQRASRGLTLLELARLMQQFGAHNAMNLDGGGSSTMLARLPGDPGATIVNHPSNGVQRPVPNGVGIVAAPGSGQLQGLRVLPAADAAANQTFSGLSRTLATKGFDENYGPATAANVDWVSTAPEVGTFEPGGVFRGGNAGTSWIIATGDGPAGRKQSDGFPVEVLGPLARIAASSAGITLNADSGPSYFGVTGYAQDSRATGIETRDIGLDYDHSVVDIVPISPEVFQVTPKTDHGATNVAIRVGDQAAVLPVLVGLSTIVVDEFENLSRWSFAGSNAQGTLGNGPGTNGKGLQLQYNFGQSTDPRTAAARATPPIGLPGDVLTIGAWVRGTGQSEGFTFNLRAADGTPLDLDAPTIDWSDWRYVELNMPANVAYPVQLEGITVRQADPTRQYSGQMQIDGLSVKSIQR